MLETVLQNLNNWFLVPDGVHAGEFTVQGGQLTLPFLQTGQYFRVVGSVFNDGLHQYPVADLTDETFTGSVWALAVPKAVIELAEEIDAWQTKNGDPGPFTSESFGGYSYSKATNASGMAVGWQDVFKSRLNDWRRIRGI
jgi:hypothetical protein|nr:MAG TPA: Protein of unknown function (DUF3199) [Caudoviricetes sp.]DAS04277.1 MAG TPA: Protein of unknown function (DUF3199) [Caudoviricetes sp.]